MFETQTRPACFGGGKVQKNHGEGPFCVYGKACCFLPYEGFPVPISDFTYSAYSQLIYSITDNGYTFCNYHDYEGVSKPCILCHDIDYDIEKALRLARLEADSHSLRSTYFVLLNTNLYNLFSGSSNAMLMEIMKIGHEVGLHFDESNYTQMGNCQDLLPLEKYIQKEISLLEQIIEHPVNAISMHRPSKITLESNIAIPGVVNRYSQVFFSDFKYISDSRHNWREDIEGIVLSKKYEKLHILTHPFWYTEQKQTCRDKLLSFITSANRKRHKDMQSNFSDLDEFVLQEEII